jgi:hypothetical protein
VFPGEVEGSTNTFSLLLPGSYRLRFRLQFPVGGGPNSGWLSVILGGQRYIPDLERQILIEPGQEDFEVFLPDEMLAMLQQAVLTAPRPGR